MKYFVMLTPHHGLGYRELGPFNRDEAHATLAAAGGDGYVYSEREAFVLHQHIEVLNGLAKGGSTKRCATRDFRVPVIEEALNP